jgi:mono/diheme cytochrome c family protein
MKDAKDILRDDAEPTVRQGAIFLPMWITGLLGLCLFFGLNYVGAHGGNYSEVVYEPYQSTNQLASFLPKDEFQAQMKLGGMVYNNVCVGCHQPHGGGNATQAPSLAGSEWVLALGPNRLIRIPSAGLGGPIKVKGVEWNLGTSMLAFGAPTLMNEEQLAAVLTYVRNSWGNKAPPVTVEQVQKVRGDVIKNHPDPYTAEELLKLPEIP